jgi:hypothetical protein
MSTGLVPGAQGGSHATYLGRKGYLEMSMRAQRSGDAGPRGSAS